MAKNTAKAIASGRSQPNPVRIGHGEMDQKDRDPDSDSTGEFMDSVRERRSRASKEPDGAAPR